MAKRRKTREKTEFGDFQTPLELARMACDVVARWCPDPQAVLEPTCGEGSFLQAACQRFRSLKTAVGIEISPSYAEMARNRLAAQAVVHDVLIADVFALDLPALLSRLPDPLLIIGNPPWVTNSELGRLGSANLPEKANVRGEQGLTARTGKSNFDVSEWIIWRMLEGAEDRDAVIGMLCKSSVARRVLELAWSKSLPVQAAIHRIDADQWFGAAVDACLFICGMSRASALTSPSTCAVFATLGDLECTTVIGWRDSRLVADVAAFEDTRHLRASEISSLRWRSGIKHDCSPVMEFVRSGSKFINGLGEEIELEEDAVFPLMKSSDLASPNHAPPRKWVLVTQSTTGQSTARLRRSAPLMWAYLEGHHERLDRRRSSIYRNRPPYSIFGIGAYSFAPWKVAISGLYKQLRFRKIGPFADRPVMLDDTAYFLPCRDEQQADFLMTLLGSLPARRFLESLIFWDGKRPITADVLNQLDLSRLAIEIGLEDGSGFASSAFTKRSRRPASSRQRSLFS